MRVQLKLLTVGSAAGPLYDGYYSTDGSTYILASDGSNLSLPSTISSVAITVPDNSTQIKLVNKSIGCNDNSFIVPVVTTTTTTTITPLQFQVSIPCVTACTTNGILTITSITGGSGPPYQTALIGFGRDTIIWNNYPEVSSYGNLQSSCSGITAQGSFGVRSTNTGYTQWNYPTLCTTTTLASSRVIITPLNGITGNNWTLYINGVASDYKFGPLGVDIPAGSIIRLDYNNNCCGVKYYVSRNPDTFQNYASGTDFTLSPGGGREFIINNTNAWTTTGYQCIGNVEYKNQINPCGQTQQVQNYPGSTCDCVCNPGCNGTYYGSPVCGSAVNLPSALVRYETYVCNNNLTGNYEILNSCSCECNLGCGTEYTGQPYCGAPDRYGKNPSSQYQDVFNSCNNSYVRTNTLDDCSCSCNQTCDGEYWGDPYCDGTGIQKRNKKYVCNGANTGEVQTLSTCSEACGAFVAPIWSPFTAPYCDGCNQFQDEVQTNVCCTNPPSGSERTVPLGNSSECGSWNIEYYCVGFDKWSRLRNSCTNNTCCNELVEVNSTYCGYSNCSTWNIIAYDADTYVYVEWTGCGGGSSSTSFYSEFGGVVGSICVQNGTSPNITSGNGQASNTGSMCQ